MKSMVANDIGGMMLEEINQVFVLHESPAAYE